MVSIAFFPFSFPGLPQVGMAFTSRRGGASKPPYAAANLSYDVGDDPVYVETNREHLRERLALDALVDCTQVHGNTVAFDIAPGTDCKADGLSTTTAGLGLMVKTADCQPVLLAHEGGGMVAGLHVGWRGNQINFPASGVDELCDHYGCKASELFAVRGPSLGPDEAEFVHFAADFGPGFEAWYNSRSKTMDLWQLTHDQLLEAGLREDRIFGMSQCTKSTPETFFSYRNEGTTGRQAGIIWLKK